MQKATRFRRLIEAEEILVQPRPVTAAAIQRMRNALSVLQQSTREGRVIERPELAVSFGEINELTGLDTIRQMEQRFLTAQQLAAKYGTAAD